MILFKLMRSLVVIVILFFSVFSVAAEKLGSLPQDIAYYPDEFYQELKNSSSSQQMVSLLKNILKKYHVTQKGKNDLVVESCTFTGDCYSHRVLKYTTARTLLMGKLHLVQGEAGDYAVRDVYCNRDRGGKEFRRSPPGPNQIPDTRVINVEHTWPQSRFNKLYPKDIQKADLHHLFPTDPQINATRGNHPFGEVSKDLQNLKCPESRFGLGSSGSEEIFEPPREHRGNVARALFYFSIRYDNPIGHEEELILRKWHREDPVDINEAQRNEEIYNLQRNRNPFIDFPELSERIADF